MFKSTAALLLIISGGSATYAFALGSDDSMTAWSQASEPARETLLDAIGPSLTEFYRTERPGLLSCLNRAGAEHDHADLPIREVIEACVSILEQSDPDGADREERPI